MNKASYDEIPQFYFGETTIVPDAEALDSKNVINYYRNLLFRPP